MKQAVIIIHGIGEQIPMETLTSFVDAVWATDGDLVPQDKPDPDTGRAREAVRNASWSKPDRRNRSYELRVITTETGKNGKRTDFFEYYWAHLINDTTLDQVRSWIFELMLRNPFTKVPRGMRGAWLLLWIIAFVALSVGLYMLRPGGEATWLGAVAAAAGAAITGAFVSAILVRHLGDVARYVKARPPNVARRQEIRENGVQLLETLMGVTPDGDVTGKRDYDRIVVVGHSLGTIIAYDILTHAFARVNAIANRSAGPFPQEARAALEEAIRDGLEQPPQGRADQEAWTAAFQALQAEARAELNQTGNPWIVSDFVTLGSPLTHAEFLMVRDRDKLGEAKRQRILPTCPPTLEFDRMTDRRHFTFRGDLRRGDAHDPAAPRLPHHAALFAYTRWSNLYSKHRGILWGDIISGPLRESFGLDKDGKPALGGIRDIEVMPCVDETGNRLAGDPRPFVSHTRYWTARKPPAQSPHIDRLRDALRLKE